MVQDGGSSAVCGHLGPCLSVHLLCHHLECCPCLHGQDGHRQSHAPALRKVSTSLGLGLVFRENEAEITHITSSLTPQVTTWAPTLPATKGAGNVV